MPVNKLRYMGDGRYIMNIPARDLTAMDLEDIAARQYRELGYAATVDEVVAFLTTNPKAPLYIADESYLCPDCGKEYKSWPAYNKHMITVHIEPETPADE